jgi:predicted adenylyl cyclase CyaB
MPRNVEIKARVDRLSELVPAVIALAQHGPVEISQDDCFFRCESGRLKLRSYADGKGELIFYRRPDDRGPKESFYVVHRTSEAESLRTVLENAYETIGRVRKHRTVFLVGRTRVHLDRVEDLGEFVEFEVVLREGESMDSGVAEANALMERLGIRSGQLVRGAYLDLF